MQLLLRAGRVKEVRTPCYNRRKIQRMITDLIQKLHRIEVHSVVNLLSLVLFYLPFSTIHMHHLMHNDRFLIERQPIDS